MKKEIAIIIPTYKPGKELEKLLERLNKQTVRPKHIYIVNTEKEFWNISVEHYDNITVRHIRRQEFDHGNTRRLAALQCIEDYMVFMTQDAMPADSHLIENMLGEFKDPTIGAVYARQLPKKNAGEIERYVREYNYPNSSHKRYQSDEKEFGIKTYFCSNVCAMYDRRIYENVGGFVKRTIFNEDMIYAAQMAQRGYGIAYAADAKVYHSHNYSGIEQFHRNFDLGVSQREYSEIFECIPSEGEGMRLVKDISLKLLKNKKIPTLFSFIWNSGCKYIGYRLGKAYKKLPKFMILRFTMNQQYWEK